MVDFTTEAPLTLLDGKISVNYRATDGVYTFSDAIVMQISDFDAMSQADITSEQQRRWDIWYAVITTPVDSTDLEDSIDG